MDQFISRVDNNDRLQMKQIAWTKNNNVIQRYDYSFGQIDPVNNTVDTTKNNGQLAQVESYIGGTVSSPTRQFTQKFSYDAIGRLEKETETRGDNSNQVYQQVFKYDRFGNRYLKAQDNPSNQNPLFPTPIEDNNIDRTTNRLASNTNTLYDDAGNTTTDGKYRNLKYFYDANGRMYKTSNTNNTNEANTVYDAGGKKVATKVNDVWRFLIYDIGGKLIAEYGGTNSTDEGGIKFIHQDLQGSTRVLTSLTGTVLSRIDYQAFGEEVPNNIGQRTSQGYGTSDSIRQRYGLTNRDEATGLDDTWFRKLEQRSGRWTSPDPYNGSMSLSNPQTFNRYSYVGNQPTNFVDPSGLQQEAPDQACSFSGRRDANGFLIYDGTIDRNGVCRSHSGSPVIVSWIFYYYSSRDNTGHPRIFEFGDSYPGAVGEAEKCGVNPITNRPGINTNPGMDPRGGRPGGLGNIRPGVRGAGGFNERTGGLHDGLDIQAPLGTPVYANRSGTISTSSWSGNTLVIDHSDGISSLYAHLSSYVVTSGAVSQGQLIGYTGDTGNAKGLDEAERHVHFGVFTGQGIPGTGDSRWIDPAQYLNNPCP